MVEPSCPAFVLLDDDAFRASLIKTFDAKHFTVTFSEDGQSAVSLLEKERRAFHVVVVGLDVDKKKGVAPLEYLKDHREKIRCGILVIAEPNPKARTFAPWVDETLL